jgi:hypothetical protein
MNLGALSMVGPVRSVMELGAYSRGVCPRLVSVRWLGNNFLSSFAKVQTITSLVLAMFRMVMDRCMLVIDALLVHLLVQPVVG